MAKPSTYTVQTLCSMYSLSEEDVIRTLQAARLLAPDEPKPGEKQFTKTAVEKGFLVVRSFLESGKAKTYQEAQDLFEQSQQHLQSQQHQQTNETSGTPVAKPPELEQLSAIINADLEQIVIGLMQARSHFAQNLVGAYVEMMQYQLSQMIQSGELQQMMLTEPSGNRLGNGYSLLEQTRAWISSQPVPPALPASSEPTS